MQAPAFLLLKTGEPRQAAEKVGDSVCRLPRAQPEDLNPQDFSPSALAPHYAAIAYSSAKLSFAFRKMTRNGESRRDKETSLHVCRC